MADLSAVTAARVSLVKAIELASGPAGEAITAGQVVGLDASGYWVKARATTGPIIAKGIALTSASLANIAIDVCIQGWVDIGDVLTALAYGADVFYSDTAGVLSDAVVSARPRVGWVMPAHGVTTTADKLLRVEVA
jgi:hypothetical protein